MKVISPIMVQYQHPFSVVGLPPIVLVSIALMAFLAGLMMGIFIGVASAFITGVACLFGLFIIFKVLAKNDRHAEKVYLTSVIYWLTKRGHYSAGVGR